jgi:predicted RNA-binding protein YlxR (DUF448 family)
MVKTKNSFTKIRCLKRAISKKELLRIVYNKAGEISIDSNRESSWARCLYRH